MNAKTDDKSNIIRCADCKYFGIFELCMYNGRCEPMEDDDYCSKGEPNESNTD